jgi:hypothetical protein
MKSTHCQSTSEIELMTKILDVSFDDLPPMMRVVGEMNAG